MCRPCTLGLLSLGRKGRTCVAEAACLRGAWGWRRNPGMVAGRGSPRRRLREPDPAGRGGGALPSRCKAVAGTTDVLSGLWFRKRFLVSGIGRKCRSRVGTEGVWHSVLCLLHCASSPRQLPLRLRDFQRERRAAGAGGKNRGTGPPQSFWKSGCGEGN